MKKAKKTQVKLINFSPVYLKCYYFSIYSIKMTEIFWVLFSIYTLQHIVI